MKFISAIVTGIAISASAAFAGGHGQVAGSVAEIVVNSEDHTTLETAVVAAGLAGTLSGTGPFTVFAPTDHAFNVLPAGLLDTVLKPENKEMLVQVLGCHVVATKAMAADVVKLIEAGGGSTTVTTIGNCQLTLTLNHGNVTINGGATVTAADLKAENGVVHVIDRVLVPAM